MCAEIAERAVGLGMSVASRPWRGDGRNGVPRHPKDPEAPGERRVDSVLRVLRDDGVNFVVGCVGLLVMAALRAVLMTGPATVPIAIAFSIFAVLRMLATTFSMFNEAAVAAAVGDDEGELAATMGLLLAKTDLSVEQRIMTFHCL